MLKFLKRTWYLNFVASAAKTGKNGRLESRLDGNKVAAGLHVSCFFNTANAPCCVGYASVPVCFSTPE